MNNDDEFNSNKYNVFSIKFYFAIKMHTVY